jgi:outer membrane lipoprotein-sorting protein
MRPVRSQRAETRAGHVWTGAPGPVRRIVVALAAAVLTLTTPALAGAPPDLFDTIYAKGQPLEQSIKTIRARFTETTTSALLVKPLVAEGTLLAVRPNDIFLSYAKPERKMVRIDATTLRFVWPDKSLRESRDIRESQARVQKYFVDKTPAELRKHFDIAAAEDAGKPGTWRIDMRPKRKQIQQGVTRIELWIDQKTSMLSTMTLTFNGGDTKTMVFSQVEINPPITLADLSLPAAG